MPAGACHPASATPGLPKPDVLNRQETGYIPLVDVEITPAAGGETQKRPFAAVARNRIEIAFELNGD